MNLCGRSIRCGDCEEFSWAPHVCEPLRKIIQQPVGLIEALNVLDKQYTADRQKLIDTWAAVLAERGTA